MPWSSHAQRRRMHSPSLAHSRKGRNTTGDATVSYFLMVLLYDLWTFTLLYSRWGLLLVDVLLFVFCWSWAAALQIGAQGHYCSVTLSAQAHGTLVSCHHTLVDRPVDSPVSMGVHTVLSFCQDLLGRFRLRMCTLAC